MKNKSLPAFIISFIANTIYAAAIIFATDDIMNICYNFNYSNILYISIMIILVVIIVALAACFFWILDIPSFNKFLLSIATAVPFVILGVYYYSYNINSDWNDLVFIFLLFIAGIYILIYFVIALLCTLIYKRLFKNKPQNNLL